MTKEIREWMLEMRKWAKEMRAWAKEMRKTDKDTLTIIIDGQPYRCTKQ